MFANIKTIRIFVQVKTNTMKIGIITHLEVSPVKFLGNTTYKVLVDSIGFTATVSTKKQLKKGDVIEFTELNRGDVQENEKVNIILKLK